LATIIPQFMKGVGLHKFILIPILVIPMYALVVVGS